MANVKGKNNFSVMPQLNDVDIIPPAGTTGQVLAKATAGNYDLEWVDNGTTNSGGTPASPNNAFQYNNDGVFGATADFLINETDRQLVIRGAAENNMVNIGGDTLVASGDSKAALYVEIDSSGSDIDGMVTYFNRTSSAPNIGGIIKYAYDGARPYIAIVDEDDDPPFITFDTVGTGTLAAPEYVNSFGSAGPIAGISDGFSWKQNGVEVAQLVSGVLNLRGESSNIAIQNTSTAQYSRASFILENITAGTGGVDRRLFLLEKNSAGAAGESTVIFRREDGNEYLDYIRILGTDNNISFNANRTTSSPTYGDVRVENGEFVIANGQLQQETGNPQIGDVLTAENTFGRAEWRPRLEIVKCNNSNTTQNLNLVSYTNVPLCGTTIYNNSTSLYTVNATTNQITVQETGWYKVAYAVYIYSTGSRNLVNFQVHIDGVATGSIQNSYIRNGTGDSHGSIHCEELFEIQTGDVIDVRAIRNSNNSTATVLASAGTSFISIERVQ